MQSGKLKVGIIGLGHWGPKLVRNFFDHPKVKMTYVCDILESTFAHIDHLIDKNCCKTTNAYELIHSPEVDVVVVITPASTHFELVKEALFYNKHVFCEKPLTLEVAQDKELCLLAEKAGLKLAVGYNFLFNKGILKLKELIQNKCLGQIYYLTATRTHLGTIREDVDVIWDLAPHDISIMNFLLDALPERVSAVGRSHLSNDKQDVAFISLFYPSGLIGQIHVSWLDSNKERMVNVIGSKARAVFDDLNGLEPVRLFEKGIGFDDRFEMDFGEYKLLLRDGDIISPKVEMQEPLKIIVDNFVSTLLNDDNFIADGRFALNISRSIAAAHCSMKKNGVPEFIENGC